MNTNYRTAHRFWSRLKGRLGETKASTPLYIPRCNAVHTFGMKFPLHLRWLNANKQVIKKEVVLPNQIRWCLGAHGVLEQHPDETNLWYNQSGQSLVEAAFVIPVLLVIVFGFIQIGLAVHQAQKLTYVTHYATQVGALTNNPAKITGAIEEFFDSEDFSISLESRDDEYDTIPDIDRQYNDILTVRVLSPFTLQIPLVSVSALDLSAEASARVLCPNTTSPYQCD